MSNDCVRFFLCAVPNLYSGTESQYIQPMHIRAQHMVPQEYTAVPVSIYYQLITLNEVTYTVSNSQV